MEPILPAPEARAPPALPDHLLEEILVLAHAPADLARAAAACKTFRRLITDPIFLRRYRSLHPPLLLGLEGPGRKWTDSFLPVEAPHPNAAAGRALAAALSFDHLPDRDAGWFCCDARNGRFLVMCTPEPYGLETYKRDLVIPELAVCDPVTRECTLLPPVPDGLVASTLVEIKDENMDFFNPFFDPSGCYDEEEQFRVICWTRSEERAAVLVYSSACGKWIHGASASWAALGLDVQPDELSSVSCWPSYAYGCFYWHAGLTDNLIKLDVKSMELAAVTLPPDHEDSHDIVLVEAGEGRIGMFSRVRSHPEHLRYSIRQNVTNARPVRTVFIPLPSEYDMYSLDGAAQGYLFLRGDQRDLSEISAFFSLHIKTLKLERLGLSHCTPDRIIPYFGFPPLIHH